MIFPFSLYRLLFKSLFHMVLCGLVADDPCECRPAYPMPRGRVPA